VARQWRQRRGGSLAAVRRRGQLDGVSGIAVSAHSATAAEAWLTRQRRQLGATATSIAGGVGIGHPKSEILSSMPYFNICCP